MKEEVEAHEPKFEVAKFVEGDSKPSSPSRVVFRAAFASFLCFLKREAETKSFAPASKPLRDRGGLRSFDSNGI